MVLPQPAEKLQQIPKPLAQLPDDLPPRAEHSVAEKQVPTVSELVVQPELGNWMMLNTLSSLPDLTSPGAKHNVWLGLSLILTNMTHLHLQSVLRGQSRKSTK